MAGSELAEDAPSTTGDLGSAMARVREMRIFGAYGPKPVWRGRIHQVAFFLSLPAGLWLLAGATTAAARVAVAVYWASMAGLFFTSSSYHLFAHSENAVKWWRRADHSMIFVLIAGTFTPLAVLGVHGAWKWPALVAVWVGALGGVAFKIFWLDRFPKLGGAMYIVVGWAGIVILPAMWHRPGTLALVALGGLLYTLGAILFALHKPILSERWFGYHEVWHAFGVAAGVVLFAANLGLVRAG